MRILGKKGTAHPIQNAALYQALTDKEQKEKNMLWNRFDAERDRLNLYENPNFEEGSGIFSRDKIMDGVADILKNMEGQPHSLIKATAFAYVLDNAAIEINPIDWFGINFSGWYIRKIAEKAEKYTGFHSPLKILNRYWINTTYKPKEFIDAGIGIVECGAGEFWCDYDHSVPDWDSILTLGFRGILERANRCRDEKIKDGTLTEAQRQFYTSVEITYGAILRLIGRILFYARKHEGDDEKMPLMIECLSTVSEGAPKNLYEFFMIIYLHHLIQEYIEGVQVRNLGNLDVDGYPYYQKDVKAGRLDREKAIELCRYFFEKFTNQQDAYAQPFYFGGFDKDGGSLINEFSFILLDAYDRSCILNPKLIVKVMPNTPDDFLKKALDMIRRGNNCFVFINEELGCRISRKLGRSEEETARLVGTGCNNFASRGRETTPEHMYVNLAKGIELAFNDGKDPGTGMEIGCKTGDVSSFKTFEDFKAAYYAQTEHLIKKAFVICDYYDTHLLDFNPTPMYSGTMPDSVRCGRDAYHDGAKYCHTVIFLSCHATAADSLMMVKKYVYDKKLITIEKLRDAMLNEWVGYEELHDMLYNDPEKFGNDVDSVDSISVELTNRFADMVNSRKNVKGGSFMANGESIHRSHKWAPKCGATPDGRRRGDLLSKNMSASFGQDRRGITAHIKSVTKLDATRFPYGCPFDYVLHASAVRGEDGLSAMLGLMRTFMKRGGYAYQGNVLDASTLRDAQAHPEKYPNLQVRISGWSWYFTQMAKNFQDEFIKRAELLES